MYSIQSNSARFIYTLSYIKNQNNNNQCRLNTGLYFSKECRSDEKIRFTETELHSIVRTVLFIHVFRTTPDESILEIINTGNITYKSDEQLTVNITTLPIFINLLDLLFGKGFATIIRRVATKCYNEYCESWRYYPFNLNIKYPSAADYVNLARFVNLSTCEYGACEKFIITNSTDNKVPLQQSTKMLK